MSKFIFWNKLGRVLAIDPMNFRYSEKTKISLNSGILKIEYYNNKNFKNLKFSNLNISKFFKSKFWYS